MEAGAARTSRVLHPSATGFTARTRGIERRIGLLFTATGIGLVMVMGVLGLIMRLTQATVIGLSPAWFYRILTLHGAGMITGVLLAMMGALWYVLHATVPLRPSRMYATYALVLSGVVAVTVATLVGGFGAGWAFLPPLPFYPAGQWSVWSESAFFVGNLLIGAGFCVYCIDILEQTTATYGGLVRTLGLRFLFGREEQAPPPQAIAATVVAIDGLISCAVGSTILVGLLGRTYDHTVGIDALVAKNLVYFYGHSIANLTIYLAAAAIYVLVPRYAGRPYATTKVFVAGWMGSLVFIATAYSHHLYMDFVQPGWAAVISAVASYGALVPGRGGHDLLDDDAHLGITLPLDARLHPALHRLRWMGHRRRGSGHRFDHPDQLPPAQHDLGRRTLPYLSDPLRGRVGARVPRSPARARRRPDDLTSRASLDRRAHPHRRIRAHGNLVRGGDARHSTPLRDPTSRNDAATASWAACSPLSSRSAFSPSSFSSFPLGREAWARRHYLPASSGGGWTAQPHQDDPAPASSPPLTAKMLPLASPAQLAVGVALCVVALGAFFPQVVDASEVSNRYHHLDHAGQFFLGAMLGSGARLVAVRLTPSRRPLRDRPRHGTAGTDADDARDGAAHLRTARGQSPRACVVPPCDGRSSALPPASRQRDSAWSPAGSCSFSRSECH